MKRESSYVLTLAILLSLMISIPADICASPQAAGQRAGEVSRLIPAVSIARGSKTINASAKSVVEWQDLLNTKADARARIALDDGSVKHGVIIRARPIYSYDCRAARCGRLRDRI